MDKDVFSIASKVAKPLSLVSVVAIALYLIYKTILGLDIFTRLGESNTLLLISTLADRVFLLSIATLALGIISFLYVHYLSNRGVREAAKLTITGNVLLASGTPVKGATVFVEGVDRRKETDDIGWFAIEVDRQASWIVRVLHDQRAVKATVTPNSIRKPVRLILPAEELQPNSPEVPEQHQDDALGSQTAVPSSADSLLVFLDAVSQHLRTQPGGRDRLESLIAVLGPLCHNNLDTARSVIKQLVYEGYLNRVSGDRYELSMQAQNTLGTRRPR